MKVDGFGSISSPSGTTKKRGVSGKGNFADLLAAAEGSETGAASAATDIAAPATIGNLLALQEIPEEYVARKKLVQQGNNMLDSLERLRRQLLAGPITLDTIYDIERQVSDQKQLVNDPQLIAIIEDIELRAAVELAKLQQSIAPSE